MRPMRRFLLALALSPLISSAATACSCVPATDEQLLARSELVFEGEVVDVSLRYWRVAISTLQSVFGVDDHEDYARRWGIKVEFAVERSWKGDQGEYLELFTGRGSGDCGYSFHQGTRYLVFASRGKDAELYTSICERPAPIEQASETIANLAKLSKRAEGAPQNHGGRPGPRS